VRRRRAQWESEEEPNTRRLIQPDGTREGLEGKVRMDRETLVCYNTMREETRR